MVANNPPRAMIAERFQPTDRINTGGFGEIWKGEDKKTNSTVVIKLPLQAADKPEEEIIDGFRQEWQILDRLQQAILPSSIVRSLAFGSESNPYSVFEYIDGVKLDYHLQRNDREPGREALREFGVPILKAIEFLHTNDIAHLDIKPENILVRQGSNQPVLIDFNTAVVGNETDTLFSSDDFKAPEQTQETAYEYTTPQCADVYAIGKLMYYLLSGETKISESTPAQAGRNAASAAGLPQKMVSIIERSLAPDPNSRLDDVGVIIEELHKSRTSVSGVQNVGILRESESSVECPVYSGDHIGRVRSDEHIPDISILDPAQYISPRHFSMSYDGKSWMLHDHSLNGTYVRDGSTWRFLISNEGYNRLSEQAPERVPDLRPPSKMRVHNETHIRPVSKEYNKTIIFKP